MYLLNLYSKMYSEKIEILNNNNYDFMKLY